MVFPLKIAKNLDMIWYYMDEQIDGKYTVIYKSIEIIYKSIDLIYKSIDVVYKSIDRIYNNL